MQRKAGEKNGRKKKLPGEKEKQEKHAGDST